MKYKISLLSSVLAAALVVLAAIPDADAAITSLGVTGRGNTGVLGDIAYDDNHQVYLHVYESGIATVGVFVGTDGVPRGGAFRIGAGRTYANKPHVAYSTGTADDVFLVTYTSDLFVPGGATLIGQFVHYTGVDGGQLVGGAFGMSQLSIVGGVAQLGDDIVYNPNTHQFLAIWTDSRGSTDTFVRTIGTSGAPIGGDINVTNAPYSQGAAKGAYDPVRHRFLVAYQGVSPSSPPPPAPEVVGAWAKVLDDTGTPVTGLLTASLGGLPIEFAAEYLPERGAFMMFWTDFGASTARDVVARVVDASGTFLTGTYPLMASPRSEGGAAGRFNSTTRTALISAMSDIRFLRGIELDGQGAPSQGPLFTLSTAVPSANGGTFYPRVVTAPVRDGGGSVANTQWGVHYVVDYAWVGIERFQGTLVGTGGGGGGGTPAPAPAPVTKALPNADPNPSVSSASNGSQTLLLQSDGGGLAQWKLSDFTLSDGALLAPGQLTDTNWQIVGTGDINSDGQRDIFWRNKATGVLAGWLMNGRSLVQSVSFSPDRVTDLNWQIVSTKDMNNDGLPDIVWQHSDGRVAVWLMNGTTLVDGFTLSVTSADPKWRVVGAADMDADGFNDLIWQHQDGYIGVWFMRSSLFLDGRLIWSSPIADTNWAIRAIADVNGDGKPDFIWQHKVNNWLATSVFDGVTLIDSQWLNPDTVSAGWHIMGPR